MNCWTIAEHTGQADPTWMQRLLSTARVDTDGLTADLRGYVLEQLGDAQGVLVVDQTGDAREGPRDGGGGPAVHGYRGPGGRLPGGVSTWPTRPGAGMPSATEGSTCPGGGLQDRARCAAAGVPADIEFATKPALARQLIATAVQAGVPCAWVGRG